MCLESVESGRWGQCHSRPPRWTGWEPCRTTGDLWPSADPREDSRTARSTGGRDTEVPAPLAPRAPSSTRRIVWALSAVTKPCTGGVAAVWWLSHVRLFVTPRTATSQASLSFTSSRSLLKLTTISFSVNLFSPPPDLCSVRVFSDWSLNYRNVSSRRCGGYKAKIRMPARWVAGEDSSCFEGASLSGCPHGVEGGDLYPFR